MLAQRGVEVSYETVHCWTIKFGPQIARNLKRRRPAPSPRWHLDEVVCNIGGKRMYLWRAVDDEHRKASLIFRTGMATVGSATSPGGFMDSQDAADLISELGEDRVEQAGVDRFRNRAALLIAMLAAALAIGGMGGGNATDDMIASNIQASDTWAFFQAKNIRQTTYEVGVEEIDTALLDSGLSRERRERLEARRAAYVATIARYDSEPDPDAPEDLLRGEGKKQISARAKHFEAQFEIASRRDNNFDMAEVCLQLALVLGSVAILALNRPVLLAAAGLGAAGALLTLNGFLLLVPLPF